ncbi:hypothetical protein CKO11_07870 [Rhodobacter sp. TJ_12]|nr:hypothetical protein [Rhodobacter sp. TJ_12]
MLLAPALFALAACVQTPAPQAPPESAATAPVPKLPGRVIWTDGHAPVAVAQAGQADCQPTSAEQAARGLAATNATRHEAGLAPLVGNRKLDRVAADHACDMAQRGLMTHTGSATAGPMARARALGYRPRIIAENIAAGRFEIDGTLAQWSASPKHRANITIPELQEFGLGMATAADGKTTFWAAVYAKKM